MYHHDPSGVKYNSYLMHLCAIFKPPWTKSVVTSSFLILFPPQKVLLVFFKRCGLFFSAKDFLKGKCLTLLYINITFFSTETVQSRFSVVLTYFVK